MRPTPASIARSPPCASEQASLRRPFEDRIRAAKLASLVPARRNAHFSAAVETPKAKRTEMQKALVAEFARVNTVTPDEIDRSLDARTQGPPARAAPPHRRAGKSPQELRHDPGAVGRGPGSADLHLSTAAIFRTPAPRSSRASSPFSTIRPIPSGLPRRRHARLDRLPHGLCEMAHERPPSAHGPRLRQPAVDAPFRPRHRADARQLRRQRPAAVAPGAARLAGPRIHRLGLGHQAHAAADR